MEEAKALYEKKSMETGFSSHRSLEDCLRRLVQRGLVAEGIGDTGADALYDLLSELYVIPISENLFLKLFSFLRLTFLSRVPYSVTKKIFRRDQRSEEDLLDALYHDEYTTSENIAYAVHGLPKCRSVLTSVANLYLRKQILFERN